MREQDKRDIAQWIAIAGMENDRMYWLVFRRGSTGRRVRGIGMSLSETDARRKYDQAVADMRQGFAALVSPGPEHKIIEYASEPMARTRW